MEFLEGLGGKSERGTWYAVQAAGGTSSDCVASTSLIPTFYNLPNLGNLVVSQHQSAGPATGSSI